MASYPADQAEAAVALLRRLAFHLKALSSIAEAAHGVINDHDLIPDVTACVPDLLSDLIDTVETHARELEAEIGLRTAA
jgi:hypothetical protein